MALGLVGLEIQQLLELSLPLLFHTWDTALVGLVALLPLLPPLLLVVLVASLLLLVVEVEGPSQLELRRLHRQVQVLVPLLQSLPSRVGVAEALPQTRLRQVLLRVALVALDSVVLGRLQYLFLRHRRLVSRLLEVEVLGT
jgi:hypothetical protein